MDEAVSCFGRQKSHLSIMDAHCIFDQGFRELQSEVQASVGEKWKDSPEVEIMKNIPQKEISTLMPIGIVTFIPLQTLQPP